MSSNPSSAAPTVPVLETSRLLMRGYQATDFPALFAMCQEPGYYRYLTPKPLPSEEVWKLLLRSAGHWAVMGYGFWVLEEKATGQLIGAAGYLHLKRDLDPPLGEAPEIGWGLTPAAHGQGYASEAVAAAITWGEEYFNHARTVCIIHPENQASLRLAEKFGYREYARTTYHDGPIVLLERAGRAG
ncbi:GNAT family N-acetyltransferase [Hymenobacter sp. BT770]|uniref:GNAT family N-acetyltransferase n=1 Tax=Hymenobacter sp. BT770 TaxID=2886942 RepID=UPI001D0F85FA|nr:GNAT family N-acetyltransferase [Hymenobacter sp. BT770]MCC3154193.1 GNAT family N-acetyltransferase [Hymenobacter sp. BT770]MDO3414360.1 GNAT family N-acetyltransferase [Hymenobacter sp. BT770]